MSILVLLCLLFTTVNDNCDVYFHTADEPRAVQPRVCMYVKYTPQPRSHTFGCMSLILCSRGNEIKILFFSFSLISHTNHCRIGSGIAYTRDNVYWHVDDEYIFIYIYMYGSISERIRMYKTHYIISWTKTEVLRSNFVSIHRYVNTCL